MVAPAASMSIEKYRALFMGLSLSSTSILVVVCFGTSLFDVRTQHIAGKQESALDQLVAAFELPVLMLDDDRAVISSAVECGEYDAPVNITQARHARNLPPHAGRDAPALVETVAVDHHVLRLHVQDMGPELADEAGLVDHQPDQMRRVVVEPDIAAPRLDDAAPDIGRMGDVVAARPFVVAEDHRAILEGQLDAVVAGVGDDVRPDLQRLRPIVIDVLGCIATAERVHHRQPHPPGGDDDLLQMVDDALAMAEIGMERIRIIAEPGDRKLLL